MMPSLQRRCAKVLRDSQLAVHRRQMPCCSLHLPLASEVPQNKSSMVSSGGSVRSIESCLAAAELPTFRLLSRSEYENPTMQPGGPLMPHESPVAAGCAPHALHRQPLNLQPPGTDQAVAQGGWAPLIRSFNVQGSLQQKLAASAPICSISYKQYVFRSRTASMGTSASATHAIQWPIPMDGFGSGMQNVREPAQLELFDILCRAFTSWRPGPTCW